MIINTNLSLATYTTSSTNLSASCEAPRNSWFYHTRLKRSYWWATTGFQLTQSVSHPNPAEWIGSPYWGQDKSRTSCSSLSLSATLAKMVSKSTSPSWDLPSGGWSCFNRASVLLSLPLAFEPPTTTSVLVLQDPLYIQNVCSCTVN